MLYAEGFATPRRLLPCRLRPRDARPAIGRGPPRRTSKGCLLNQRFASTNTSSARLRSAERLASIKLSRRPSRMIARLVVMAPVRLWP
jgi:hypothetical protein